MITSLEKILVLINEILENLLKLSETKFAQTLTGALIGAFVSVGVFIGTQIWTNKREKRKQKETVLNVVTQNHKELFSLIFEGAQNEKNVDYEKLRAEYKRIGLFIYMLPIDLQTKFSELHKVHNNNPSFYKENKQKIPKLCKEITNKIQEYGVDVFE
ncbi:hypothetical protein [Priestia megaterium]|uniref:hypothetical protein n=1 Tax=Priestia megaterium TaxID=1404 RepID=UPI00101DAF23|nr:hypothetical protein [Priestia megaterium]